MPFLLHPVRVLVDPLLERPLLISASSPTPAVFPQSLDSHYVNHWQRHHKFRAKHLYGDSGSITLYSPQRHWC